VSHWETAGRSDEWYTPRYIFDALNCRFDLDVAPARAGRAHVPANDGVISCGLSADWPHFGLNTPPRSGGWVNADFHGGWTCCVEQGRYGHYARKPTLIVVYGVSLMDLESLMWGIGEPRLDPAVIEHMGLKRAKRLGEVGAKGGGTDSTPRIGTPAPFRDLLLATARLATPQTEDER
jgi:hypothetical protein